MNATNQSILKLLSKFQNSKMLYNAEHMGAGIILKHYLEFPEDVTLPLTHPHGLQYFGRQDLPLDINAIDPIYWATNEEQKLSAQKIKSAVLLPHPMTILMLSKKNIQSEPLSGVLVVGPPSGPYNDEQLFHNLRKRGVKKFSLLIKERGPGTYKSKKFWAEKNIHFHTAGPPDSGFYLRLYKILSGYELIIFCTASSAISFASSMGKHILLLDDYSYKCYDIYKSESIVNYMGNRSDYIIKLLKLILDGAVTEYRDLSRNFLGYNHSNPLMMRNELYEGLVNTNTSLYHAVEKRSLVSRWIIDWLALVTTRRSLHSSTLSCYMKERFLGKGEIYLCECNDLSIVINGLNSKNFIYNRSQVDLSSGRWPGYGV